MEPVRLPLTVEEAAALLGISRTPAYELIAGTELPHLRLGRPIVAPPRLLGALVDTDHPQSAKPATYGVGQSCAVPLRA